MNLNWVDYLFFAVMGVILVYSLWGISEDGCV